MIWNGYVAFLVAALVVAAAPGPTVLQIFSQSMSGDLRRPASLIAGSILANALMVVTTVLGLNALILASQPAFNLLKFIGSAYLIYLGIHYWRMRAEPIIASGHQIAKPYRVLFLKGALTSITNPKGLVFYVAFLPQFVTLGSDPHDQLAILGISYIVLCLFVDIGYALAGRAFSRLAMTARAVRLKNRITGTIFIAVALSLMRYERA
jgi:homoserine/homoserine lactone efflux protein